MDSLFCEFGTKFNSFGGGWKSHACALVLPGFPQHVNKDSGPFIGSAQHHLVLSSETQDREVGARTKRFAEAAPVRQP